MLVIIYLLGAPGLPGPREFTQSGAQSFLGPVGAPGLKGEKVKIELSDLG